MTIAFSHRVPRDDLAFRMVCAEGVRVTEAPAVPTSGTSCAAAFSGGEAVAMETTTLREEIWNE
ncbi:MAG: hypothetical protein KAI47_25705 [Deltaproteobacteria bacterium]|nr:hypothetical protein [Deltaproteobacteria bacterium]